MRVKEKREGDASSVKMTPRFDARPSTRSSPKIATAIVHRKTALMCFDYAVRIG